MNERNRAALVCLASIPAPFMGPLWGLITSGGRPFVRFHAIRCLLQEVFASLIIGTLMALSLAYTLYSFYQKGFDLSEINWWAVIIKSLVTWALLGLWAVVNFVMSIRDALQALDGQMPTKLGVSGRIAARWSGITNHPTA